jgi:hypothetical protein
MRLDHRRRDELEHDVQEAWEALRYWQERHERLGRMRLRDRREAAAAAAAWKVRLREAERAAFGPPVWEPVAVALRLHRVPERMARMRRRVRRAVIVGVASLAALAGASAATVAIIVERVLG